MGSSTCATRPAPTAPSPCEASSGRPGGLGQSRTSRFPGRRPMSRTWGGSAACPTCSPGCSPCWPPPRSPTCWSPRYGNAGATWPSSRRWGSCARRCRPRWPGRRPRWRWSPWRGDAARCRPRTLDLEPAGRPYRSGRGTGGSRPRAPGRGCGDGAVGQPGRGLARPGRRPDPARRHPPQRVGGPGSPPALANAAGVPVRAAWTPPRRSTGGSVSLVARPSCRAGWLLRPSGRRR